MKPEMSVKLWMKEEEDREKKKTLSFAPFSQHAQLVNEIVC